MSEDTPPSRRRRSSGPAPAGSDEESRALHDDAIQRLFAVALELEAAIARLQSDPESVARTLDDSIDLLNQVIDSIRVQVLEAAPPPPTAQRPVRRRRTNA